MVVNYCQMILENCCPRFSIMARTKRLRKCGITTPNSSAPQPNASELVGNSGPSRTQPDVEAEVGENQPQLSDVGEDVYAESLEISESHGGVPMKCGPTSITQPDSEVEAAQNQPQLHDPGEEVCTDVLEILDSQGRVRTKCGPTRAKEVWSLPHGEKIIIRCNDLGQPVKKGGGILGGWLGAVARKGGLCPLNYTDWRLVPASFKKKVIRLARKKFDLPSSPMVDKWVLQSLGSKWKEFKYGLKCKYMVEGCNEEHIVSKVPPKIDPSQWKELVHYWFSDRSKLLSSKGKAARGSQKIPHTMGSKSFARCRDEYLVEHGKEPGRIEFFEVTHKRKDGTFINQDAQQFMEAATALMEECAGASESSQDTSLQNEIFTELLGDDHGRVKGYGLGATPSNVFGPQDQNNSTKLQEEIESLRVQVQSMQEKYETKLTVMQEHYETKLAVVNAELVQVTSVLQELRETSKEVIAMMRNSTVFRGVGDQDIDEVPAESSSGSWGDDERSPRRPKFFKIHRNL